MLRFVVWSFTNPVKGLYFLFSILLVWYIVVFWILVNLQIGRFKNEAIAWDSLAFSDHDNISNDEFPNTDSFGGSEFTSNDSDTLLLDQRLELNEFLILTVIGNRGNQNDCQSNQANEHGFQDCSPTVCIDTANTSENSCDSDNDPHDVLHFLLEWINDWACWWKRLDVFTISINTIRKIKNMNNLKYSITNVIKIKDGVRLQMEIYILKILTLPFYVQGLLYHRQYQSIKTNNNQYQCSSWAHVHHG